MEVTKSNLIQSRFRGIIWQSRHLNSWWRRERRNFDTGRGKAGKIKVMGGEKKEEKINLWSRERKRWFNWSMSKRMKRKKERERTNCLVSQWWTPTQFDLLQLQWPLQCEVFYYNLKMCYWLAINWFWSRLSLSLCEREKLSALRPNYNLSWWSNTRPSKWPKRFLWSVSLRWRIKREEEMKSSPVVACPSLVVTMGENLLKYLSHERSAAGDFRTLCPKESNVSLSDCPSLLWPSFQFNSPSHSLMSVIFEKGEKSE